jgi:hypothetical protein
MTCSGVDLAFFLPVWHPIGVPDAEKSGLIY